MNGSNNPNYGNKWNDEQRKKASDFWKGKTFEERIGEERAKELKRKKSEMYRGENNPMFGISPMKKECPICNKIVDIFCLIFFLNKIMQNIFAVFTNRICF